MPQDIFLGRFKTESNCVPLSKQTFKCNIFRKWTRNLSLHCVDDVIAFVSTVAITLARPIDEEPQTSTEWKILQNWTVLEQD
jgi:hypothetical protein